MAAAVAARKPARKPANALKPPRGPRSDLERALQFHLRVAGLPEPEWQLRFHPRRRWELDGGWRGVGRMVAFEVDGGQWPYRDKQGVWHERGRHLTGTGFEGDCLKLSEAAVFGWRVLRLTRKMIEDGTAVDLIARALDATERTRTHA